MTAEMAYASASRLLGLGGLVGAEAHLLLQRGGDRWYLLAVGGLRNRDLGLVEDGLGAGALLGDMIEQLSDQHAVLAVGIIDDLAGRCRRQDQRVIRRGDRRQPVREGAEPPLVRIAARGVDHRK